MTPAELAGLTITPPAHSDSEFQLTVTATATETNPTSSDTTVTTLSASTSATIDVQVDAVADAPTLNCDLVGHRRRRRRDRPDDHQQPGGYRRQSETLSIEITGVPAGATLSAGTDNGGGSWTLTPAELAGLTITPPLTATANSS